MFGISKKSGNIGANIYVPPEIIENRIKERILYEQKKSLMAIEIDDIDSYHTRIPKFNTFHTEKNTLEAIVLLTTSYEIVNGQFSRFIKNMLDTLNKLYSIHFIISVNNGNYTSINKELAELEKVFSNIEVLDIQISPEIDVYKIEDLYEIDIPKYGLTSGPNILFWNTMKTMKKYNTTLVLETDCILYDNWLDTLIQYVEHCGDFLISGSTYSGNYRLKSTNTTSFFHINGVALYKTGSIVFHYILDELIHYIPCEVKKGHLISAYDYMLTKMILEKLDNTEHKDFDFWKLVYRYIIKNTFIINASMRTDKKESEEKYLEQFPRCVILHKKLIT